MMTVQHKNTAANVDTAHDVDLTVTADDGEYDEGEAEPGISLLTISS